MARRIVVQTDGGVGYEVTVPLGVAGRLPRPGGRVSLYTELVVKEDGWSLFGFDRAAERQIFQRLLGASGFGPKLALALLSALGPERTVRSIRARDLAALSSVGGIGRKKAERLVLELQDRFDDVALEPPTAPAPRHRRGGAGAHGPGLRRGRGGRRGAGRARGRVPGGGATTHPAGAPAACRHVEGA